MSLQFMSLGGCCADMPILGDLRVRGPVDNYKSLNGLKDALGLFNGDFEKQMFEEGPLKVKSRVAQWKGDCEKSFYFRSWENHHIDYDNPHIKDKIKERCQAFKDFIQKVKTDPDCYFVWVLTKYDTQSVKDWGKHPNDEFKAALAELGNYIPLEKLLIIGTKKMKKKSSFNAYFSPEDLPGQKYLDIESVEVEQISKRKARKNHEDFLMKIKSVL